MREQTRGKWKRSIHQDEKVERETLKMILQRWWGRSRTLLLQTVPSEGLRPQSFWMTPSSLSMDMETLLDPPPAWRKCVSLIWARPSRPCHPPEPAQLHGHGLVPGADHHGPAGVPSDLLILGTQEFYQGLQPTCISQLEVETRILHIKSIERKHLCLKKTSLFDCWKGVEYVGCVHV